METVLDVFLLEEEFEDEDVLILNSLKKRNTTDSIFKSRRIEGVFEILIKRHLFNNEKKFQEYFRLSRSLFKSVLNSIKSDINKEPYRNRKPISPEEKLCITLRFVCVLVYN